MNRPIIIGSRGSDLALWQARFVQSQLTSLGHQSEIQIIKTQGDRVQDLSFDKLEGKGFFTKELEDKLLSSEIDLAVHSHKDLPTENPPGLMIAAVSDREDPADLLLIDKTKFHTSSILNLPEGAVVGTSSARRKSQLLHARPDLELKELRGNVPTRIQKLRDGAYDAILLAAAGIKRLNLVLDDLQVLPLDPLQFIPAPAQGVLGLQVRESDIELRTVLAPLNNLKIAKEISVERRILNLFEGGCQMPLGAYCTSNGAELSVTACVANAWNAPLRLTTQVGNSVEELARAVVSELRAK